ncbi:MAG: peptidoglycan DD-metalloendopeptidase family protein [Lachnospiraceae bacterium]|nr:peptidoglycan DD-metalloendopeptidase family protein [Lachnospiraceae bacterium]
MKKSRLWKYIICLIFLAMFTESLSTRTVIATGVTEESIKKAEDEIKSQKDQLKSMKSGLTDIEAVKKQLKSKKADINSYMEELDSQLTQIQGKIDELDSQIEEKNTQITETRKELETAKAVQQEQYDAMKARIRYIYESGGKLTYLDLIMSAGGLDRMLNQVEYVEALSAYDRGKLDEYAGTVEYVKLMGEKLDSEMELLSQAKSAAVTERANANELLDTKEAEMDKVNGELGTKEEQAAALEKAIAAENAEIAALEKRVAAQKAALTASANASRRTFNGGVFAWPAPSYTRISDDYGNRIHPTLGVKMFHNGVDIASPSGSPILAAYDGDVVAAGYSSTMGNYIMIDHGSGLYTIYMHASALYTSTGASVSKGQKIAAVGSTGRSTGPHLHFGVRSNGNYVSPWNYLK